jgi:uncharacterized protein (DUF885 family)
MKQNIILTLSAIIISACNPGQNMNETEKKDNQSFEVYKETFIEELWKIYPSWSTAVGYKKYDSLLISPDDKFRTEEMKFILGHLDSLAFYSSDELDANNRTDYYLIKNFLESNRWRSETFRKYQWDPSEYNVASGFAHILNDMNRSLSEKTRLISFRLDNVPAYYEAAKKNIQNPTLEHTNLAIQQSRGTLKYFDVTLRDSINQAPVGTHEQHLAEAKLNDAVRAIQNYIDWLENELKPQTKRSFRIGKEMFNQKFAYDIVSRYSADEIYEKALKRKEELHAEMLKLSLNLWPKYFKKEAKADMQTVKELINRISTNHVHRDEFLSAIEKQIPELERFIAEKDLIYMDPSKPLVVRKTPEYMDGVAGASISSPGPYDKEGNTYYNVSPLTGMSDAEAESYLREYNHYILQILNIHEAIPGHYMQLVYSNQSPSIIKSILGNGSMIEGWAVYTERMMLEEGYGNHEPEMWLMYYKWHLRVVCNTILDYSVHVLGMTEEQALNLLMNEAFQEEAEARGKWKRATLSQVQLCSYFTGYTEIYELREEMKQVLGEQFKLKDFHEKFLSYGSAPVKYIREMMLNELETNTHQ